MESYQTNMNLTPDGERDGKLGGSITNDARSKESSPKLSGVMCPQEWAAILSLPHLVWGWEQPMRNLVEAISRALSESRSL